MLLEFVATTSQFFLKTSISTKPSCIEYLQFQNLEFEISVELWLRKVEIINRDSETMGGELIQLQDAMVP